MSIEFEDIANEIKKPPGCEVCGNYGYVWAPGDGGARRCPSCGGDKRSRNPKHYRK